MGQAPSRHFVAIRPSQSAELPGVPTRDRGSVAPQANCTCPKCRCYHCRCPYCRSRFRGARGKPEVINHPPTTEKPAETLGHPPGPAPLPRIATPATNWAGTLPARPVRWFAWFRATPRTEV